MPRVTVPHMDDGVSHCGYFTVRDALLTNGMSYDEVRTGPYRRLFQGVYAVPGEEIDHELRCRAATAFCPRGAMLTGASALTVHGVPLAQTFDDVTLLIGERVPVHRSTGIVMRRGRAIDDDWTPWHGIRLATPTRAVFDALRSLPPRRSIGCADAAVRAGAVHVDELYRLLAERHDNGVVRARKVVELIDARSESPKESELRVVLLLSGIALEPQLEITLPNGRKVRADLGDDELKVLVEYDGAWHGAETEVLHDRRRRKELRDAGWHVIVVTADELRGSARQLCDRIGAVLDSRRAAVA